MKVLNINYLANAFKPVVLPGEEMVVHIIKDGKQQDQGIAYLDDGTMIVVEDGRNYIGKTIHVLVTSLQTSQVNDFRRNRNHLKKHCNEKGGSIEPPFHNMRQIIRLYKILMTSF